MYAEIPTAEVAKARAGTDRATFQQFYAENNRTFKREFLSVVEQAGSQAVVWRIDAPAVGPRIRNERYTLPATTSTKTFMWDYYNELRNVTKLPIVPKGILTVEDPKIAVNLGALAIILSNHGARHLDRVTSPLQVALAIYNEAPEIFGQNEVLADCGIRYETDVLKLMALGIRAVGLGHSFMYANVYGQAGAECAIDFLKTEPASNVLNLEIMISNS